MLTCMAFRWRMWWGAGVSAKMKTWEEGRELPWCLHETISFHLGLNSRELEIRRGIGEGGGDLEGCKSAGFSGPVSSTASFSLSPSLLLWGINTFQRMSSIPLTGERASHSGRPNSCKGG